ncbi:hypothetical protein RJT34_18786 [Clitoria ternatea]|uniref:Uncharacterized protein n=1 Tax=Clitoria ternatea TaxID=43366 RepID=A0AAN9JBF4_CLITE
MEDCDSSFERYDPISKSWISKAFPPCYVEFFNNYMDPCFWPSCPVVRRSVKDDKLFFYCLNCYGEDLRINVFSHLSQNWEIITLPPPIADLIQPSEKPVATIYSSNGIPQYYQSHLFDLGQVGQDNQKGICAVMTSNAFTNVNDVHTGRPCISDLPTSLLFISVFDVKMLQLSNQIRRPPHVAPNPCQLLKVSIVEKFVFRLENSFYYPMFNAFVL